MIWNGFNGDRKAALAAVLILGPTLAGCQRGEIVEYRIPKEEARPPIVATAAPGAPHAHWTLPKGWNEKPAGGMRVGSFSLEEALGGDAVDISIIPITGPIGSELANVNRWLSQIGLDPVDEAGLAKLKQEARVGDGSGVLYDLGAGGESRTLAATRTTGDVTWYVKMTGPSGPVAAQSEAFSEFLGSLELETRGHGQASAPQAPAPPAAKPSGDLSWELPEGWTEQPAGGFRLASFQVNQGGGKPADVSITRLGGDGGGLLANVNRWRGQLGLPPTEEAGLKKDLVLLKNGDREVPSVVLTGRDARTGTDELMMLAAILPAGGTTWFVKMTGPNDLVSAQREAFAQFIQTLRLPHAG